MSKGKSIVVLILLFVALTPLCANDIFSIGFGASLSYTQNSTEEEPSFKFNTNNIAIGLEGRMNVSYFQMDAVGEISVLDSDTLKLAGIVSVGGSVELFEVVKLGLTVGPRIAYIYSNVSKRAEELEISNGKNLLEAIKTGPINIRLMLDVFAGPVMSIGFAYTIPTEFTIEKGNWESFAPSSQSFLKGQVSLSIQMKVF